MLIDGGLSGVAAWQTCDAAGISDGTCVNTRTAVLDGNQNTLLSSYLCIQGGSSDGGCDPTAIRTDVQDLCVAGLFCQPPGFFSGLDGGACRQGCTPGLAGNCPASQSCGADSECHEIGNGGCLEGLVEDTAPCSADSDCGCPLHCRPDPGLGINRCVESCQTSPDCSLDDDHCAGGLCLVNFCAQDLVGNAAPGLYAQPCDAVGSGDGNCIAVGYEAAGFPDRIEFGVCLRGGSASASCALPFGGEIAGFASFALVSFPTEIGAEVAATGLCAVGQVCAFQDAGLACTFLCDPIPDGGDVCPTGACVEQGGDPVIDLGACLACLPSGDGCSLPSDCCSRSCRGSQCQ